MFSKSKKTFLTVSLVFVAISVITFTEANGNGLKEENSMPAKTIKDVLKEHTKDLMSLPGVVGTAQGLCDDKPCIKIFVIEKTPELDAKIPENLEGYPVSIEETGEIRALPKDQD
jgi:hypothetical protein